MATVTSTVQNTTQKKPVTNLPLQDPNNPNQPVQIIANQAQPAPTSSAGVQAAEQSFIQANKLAQQGFQSPTVQLTSQKTQQLLQDPTHGMNYEQNIQNRLTQADRENAQAIETARQGMAGAAGSSINQQALMELALKNQESKSDLQTELEAKAATAKQDALIKALAEGRSTAAMEQGQFNTNVDALIKARTTVDNEMARQQETTENALTRAMELAKANQNTDLQLALANIDAKTKQGLQASEQDWQAVQNQLNREQQTALQANDINAVKNNLQLQLDFDKQMQQSGQQFTAEQNALNRALETSLKSLDINSAKELAALKAKLDSDLMTQEQDWKSVQSALDRAATEALQKGDIAGQIQITQLKGEIDAAQQKAQLEWSTSERVATQVYNTSERLDQNTYDKAAQYLEQQHELAVQSNDITLQKYLQDKQAALDLKMQTQDFDQQTKMTYLESELADARANNDVERQKQIIQFQTMGNIEEISAQQGADAAIEKVRADLQLALQNDDQAAAEALQRTELQFKVQESVQDRMIEQARIDLQAKQVDIAQVEQQYNQIADLVEQGILPPEAEYDFMMGTLKAHGVDTAGGAYRIVDAQAQAERALQQEYDLMKTQFLQTHPDYVKTTIKYDNGTLVRSTNLTSEGLSAFNEYVNSTMYGELTAEQKAAKETAGYLGASDISTADSGDKFAFNEPTTYNGQTIPAGKYSVTTKDVGHGSKFWGTAYTNTHKYLVNEETGQRYEIASTSSGTYGNIISGLWADNGGIGS